jgi:S1-C subfamily serine protease
MTFVPTNFQPVDMMDNLMKILMSSQGKTAPKIVAPGGLLGFKVHKDADDQEAGVDVKEVLPNSPAAKAGLKEGDRLLTLDDRWTDSVADCFIAASRLLPGTPARAVILRAGKEKELKIEPIPGT